jgi:phosphoglycerate dehydrogenase-like enzyme
VDVVNVAVLAPHLGRDLGYITDVDPRIRVVDDVADAEVILVGYPVPPDLGARAPRLQWAQHTQAGVSNLLRSDLWAAPVTLTSSRGLVAATAIAEYVLAAAAHFARGLHEAVRQQRDGVFSREGYETMTTLRGATMGVIGLGGIGQEVARLAKANGMRVIGTRHSVTTRRTDSDGADLVLPADGLLEIAAGSDFVAVCSQLTDETRGFIDATVLAAMKPSAVLINIARGEEVDEDALIEAVTAGRIRGAVLDVHAGETDGRPPRPELVELPQVTLTPHISGLGGDAATGELVRALFTANLRRFLDGQPLVNEVDRQRGY